MLREKLDAWKWGVPHERQPRLKVLTDALQRLARKGLTAPAVIANFHRQRVIPLMERRLAIFELAPKAVALRVKSAVSHFPSNPEDL